MYSHPVVNAVVYGSLRWKAAMHMPCDGSQTKFDWKNVRAQCTCTSTYCVHTAHVFGQDRYYVGPNDNNIVFISTIAARYDFKICRPKSVNDKIHSYCLSNNTVNNIRRILYLRFIDHHVNPHMFFFDTEYSNSDFCYF